MGAPLDAQLDKRDGQGAAERLAEALERIALAAEELSEGQGATNKHLGDIDGHLSDLIRAVENSGANVELDLGDVGTAAHPFIIESR